MVVSLKGGLTDAHTLDIGAIDTHFSAPQTPRAQYQHIAINGGICGKPDVNLSNQENEGAQCDKRREPRRPPRQRIRGTHTKCFVQKNARTYAREVAQKTQVRAL